MIVGLDRNPDLNDSRLISYGTKNTIVIDGDLHELAPKDSIEFSNNDNNIIVYSSWNKKNVYFGIRVEDSSIISHFPPESDNYIDMPLEDDVEIYIDTDHNHNQIRDSADISFF